MNAKNTKSLCYLCTSWEWDIVFSSDKQAWQHICNKGYQAGDDVKECKGFEHLPEK